MLGFYILFLFNFDSFMNSFFSVFIGILNDGQTAILKICTEVSVALLHLCSK